ncbi:unnamed protein product [Prorocentrum cordatum]|uniref:Uncharacterized protein n=1 Tax=Prorocentrum cordatum TaxID=2364126 RepID=A0ABN9XHQ0_9DINO|nr:unnamed protein product [Polarella glacialis]
MRASLCDGGCFGIGDSARCSDPLPSRPCLLLPAELRAGMPPAAWWTLPAASLRSGCSGGGGLQEPQLRGPAAAAAAAVGTEAGMARLAEALDGCRRTQGARLLPHWSDEEEEHVALFFVRNPSAGGTGPTSPPGTP